MPDDIHALIFDFDGTLADSMPSHYLAWHATVARHGITFSEQRFYELAGWSTRHLADMLVQEFGANISGERLAQEKEAEFQRMTVHIVPIQPVIDIAAENRGKLPMAVATSGMRKIVTPILEELKILDWFDAARHGGRREAREAGTGHFSGSRAAAERRAVAVPGLRGRRSRLRIRPPGRHAVCGRAAVDPGIADIGKRKAAGI